MSATALEPIRVLLVDDDPDDVELTRELLRAVPARRYDVQATDRYDDALDALVAGRHHVAIVDYRLGERDGLELLGDAGARGATTPVLLLTGYGDDAVERRALELGAADYLVKGQITPAVLEREIRHAIERSRTLAALRDRERLFRAVFDGALDAILIADDDGRYVDANPAALALLGVTREQLLGTSLHDVMPARDLDDARAAWREFLRTGRMEGELEVRRPDGGLRLVELRATASVLPGRHLSVLRDLTERKRFEAQIALADRMASFGMLAAGVGHEIDNPLAAVVANLDFVADELRDPGVPDLPATWLRQVQEPLAEARGAADRIREIVRDLRLFARPDERRGPVDVARVIESSIRLAWNEIRHRARLVKDFARVPPVDASEGRLGQVFLNLLINAAHAIPEGDAAHHEIRIVTGERPGQVIVEIRDTGCGIPPDHLPRLFEPFFTTKPVGVGTGLGLPICLRIVHELGGDIEVDSEVGKGAVFRVILPESRAEHDARPAATAAEARAARRGTILVIDDEPMIARVIRRTLGADHDVVAMTDAAEALAALRSGDRYDVILCDVMMPQMTGIDLYDALAAELPDVARTIVFLTGGAFTPRARAFLDQVPNQRLEKPFEAAQLRALVTDRLR